MTRLATFGAVLPLLAAGALGCSDNNDAGPPIAFSKFEVLSDFEDRGMAIALIKDPRWEGQWEKSSDTSPGKAQTGVVEDIEPRMNPTGTPMSTRAYHVSDFGDHTQWGSAWLVTLNNYYPVDLSGYTGISLWMRSDNFPPPTVKVAITDHGSYPYAKDPVTKEPANICDPNDVSVGGRGCYDDYSIRIYPDTKWRRYDIPFSSLTTGGWGLPHSFDPTHIYSIKFAMLAAVTYSIWTDDVAIYLR